MLGKGEDGVTMSGRTKKGKNFCSEGEEQCCGELGLSLKPGPFRVLTSPMPNMVRVGTGSCASP